MLLQDQLEFHVGHRSFDARPLFSQDDLKSDRNKMDRFFLHGKITNATAFAPICYSPSPVLVFKRVPLTATEEKEALLYPSPDRITQLQACTAYRLELVATGSVSTCDANRIILKKSILSGYPIRVKRRTALVKLMFFNPVDILHFKPVELFTKHGLIGMWQLVSMCSLPVAV
jgi:pre-rRNA-processing protein TSR1